MYVIRTSILYVLISAVLIFTTQPETSAAEKTRGTVTFIFDDGRINITDKAYPVFKKHKVPASVAMITNVLDRKGYMTKQNLVALNKNGWEVLSHGVSHLSLRTMNNHSIETELKRSKEGLNKLGIKVNGFVAPYSYFPQNNMNQLKKYYSYAFIGYVDSRKEPVNKLISNAKNPFNLVRANMEGKTLKELKHYIDYAHERAIWLVLYEHEIGTKNHLSVKDLDALLSYAKQKKVSIRTPGKVYGIR
jgi:peptidoglycan/xylan/chitin deacetylase (PgdA/CDA1 family)